MDFDQARAAHSALKDFFATHAKGRLDRGDVHNVAQLCRQAAQSVSDGECRDALGKIERYSELLSGGEHAPRGNDYVRLRVQNALALFRSHLKGIEAAQR
jgi:hypothetical protein